MSAAEVIEVCVAALTVVTVSGLSFTRWLVKHDGRRDPESLERRRQAFAERRRILERDREEWWRSLRSEADVQAKHAVTHKLAEIDAALLALAKEEAEDAAGS